MYMNTPFFIPIILGTNREGRQSEHVAKWIHKQLEDRDDIKTKLVDVRDFSLPEDDYGQAIKESFTEYRDMVCDADGFIIVAPEYNHGYSGRLKSVLDILLPEYIHKAVGLVGVSAGPWGGTRVIEALLPVMRELGLVTASKDLNFPSVKNMFDENGIMKEKESEESKKRLTEFMEELLFLANALKVQRERKV